MSHSVLRGPAPVLALLALYLALTLLSVTRKSPGFDETAHIITGYANWKLNDYRLQPENGVFPQKWAALPLLVQVPNLPPLDQAEWAVSDVWSIGRRFLYESGNDPQQILFAGRFMIALLGVAVGVIVYVWSRRLSDRSGGLSH